MITLHQFAPAWGIPNPSPFCVKVELYLRMAGLPYEVATAIPPAAPKGKLPYITDGGKRIADSNLIIRYLKATYGDRLDTRHPAAALAIAHAMRRLLEEHLYWTVVYSRWVDARNWEETRRALFGRLPPGLAQVMPAVVRRRIRAQLHAQGLGRHTAQEIYQLGVADIAALAAFLDDKLYFLGEEPSSLDASALGFLLNLIEVPIESPLKDYALNCANLVTYCSRLRRRYFADCAAAASPAAGVAEAPLADARR